MTTTVLVALIGLAAPAPQNARPDPETGAVFSEVRSLRSELAAAVQEMRARAEGAEALRREVAALTDEIGAVKERMALSVAGPFLTAPPPSSDAVGVAKVAVFAPRLEIDSARRHDLLSLRVRRLEPGAARVVAELDFTSDQTTLDLPLDQNGALYVVEWSTSEGHAYTLSLQDGTSALTAAVVQVKPLQAKGRFIFVGYRVE
jgi:hypothetical protein